MGEAAYSLESLAENPDQRAALTDEQLHDLLIADKIIFDEGKAEGIKPISVMMIWAEEEILSIIQDIEGDVDKPITFKDVTDQLEYLQKRFESMIRLLGIVRQYKTLLFSLKEQYSVSISDQPGDSKQKIRSLVNDYLDSFVSGLREYLQTESEKEYRKSTTPFPIEITKLPLALLTLEPDDLLLFDNYVHDLFGLINRADGLILGCFDPKVGMDKDVALAEVQIALANIIEFHKPYDMLNMNYILADVALVDARAKLTAEFPVSFNRAKRSRDDHEVTPDKPVKFLRDDQSRAFLGSEGLDQVKSFFSSPFLIKLVSNIRQNIERVNKNLGEGSEELISQVTATLTYELLDAENFVPVENQKIIDGQGVWITLKISDNGPGFPAGSDDVIATVDGEEVRFYQPDFGKSGHNGEGIGLAGIKADVEAAGGFFETYTPTERGGAVIYVSFPLLNA